MSKLIKDKTQYLTTLGDGDGKADARLTIGGKNKFVPNINASKWNDEAWLNINHSASIVTNQKERFKDGKIEISVSGLKHRYYIDEEGHLEYEIIFTQKPPINILTFDLDFSDGLKFLYQDTLENEWEKYPEGETLEEYLQARYRPENVIDSYEIYWKKKHNEFKTGKFAHWQRNKLTDAKGNWTWVDKFVIDSIAKKAFIYLPSKWLEEAIYPIILGPNLGYDTAGGSSYGGASGKKYGVRDDTDGIGGNINNFHVATAASASANMKMGVFTNDGGATPGIVVEQVEFAPGVSDDENTPAAGQSLTASTTYWIVFCWSATSTTVKYTSGGGDDQAVGSSQLTYADEIISPEGDMNLGTSAGMSIWVDYAPAGGAVKELLVGAGGMEGGFLGGSLNPMTG